MIGESKTSAFCDTGCVNAEEVTTTASRAGVDLTIAASFLSSGQTAATEDLLSFHQTRPPIKITAVAPIAITAIRSELRPLLPVVGAGVDGTG